MSDTREILTFDTSGLNALAKEPNSRAMAARLGSQFYVRLTEPSLAELVATEDAEFRAKLAETCQRLLVYGDCVGPHHLIVIQQIKAHANADISFNWQETEVCSPALEEEVRNPRFLNDDAVAAESREKSAAAKREFKQLFRDAREAFPIPPAERIGITLTDVVDLSVVDSAYWRMAVNIYERCSGIHPSEAKIRAFVRLCPPFNAMMLSTCVAHFHGSVRDHRLKAMYDAGLIDLMCSAFLPYCDRFVTTDEGQFNALTEIAKLARLSAKVMYYEDLIRSLP